jgi:hypothetical protein
MSYDLGGWVFDSRTETGTATGVVRILIAVAGEVAAANVVEVVVKEQKKISTWLVRMSTMLAGKTTPNRATMLHSEFLITPTWRPNC